MRQPDDAPVLQVDIPPEKLEQLRGEEAFHVLLTLARTLNFLKFAALASQDVPFDGSPHSERQHANTFILICAVLNEGARTLKMLGKHYRDYHAYRAFVQPLLADRRYQELRTTLLKRLRNKSAFHFDRDAPQEALRDFVLSEYHFVVASGPSSADRYYPLADEVFIHFILGGESESEEIHTRKVQEWMEDVEDLSLRFIEAGDALVVGALERLLVPAPHNSEEGDS